MHVVYRYRTTKSATESQRFTIRQVPIGEFCKLCTNLNTIFALKYSQCLDFLQQNRLNQITDVLSTGWHNHFSPYSKFYTHFNTHFNFNLLILTGKTQEIVEHLTQIFFLSQLILKHDIREVLQSHDITVSETHTIVSATAKGKQLSSTKRRKTVIENNYPVVKPVQFLLQPGHTAVHVPILELIQNIFNHTDILDKIKERKVAQNSHYVSHQDGLYKENTFLSSDELKITLILYIDDWK